MIQPINFKDTLNILAHYNQLQGDGYNKNQPDQMLLNANHDIEAIQLFLYEFKEAEKTLRSYSKELERLLLWCLHIGKIQISSLRRDHLVQYLDFLKNPIPQKIWCGPKVPRFLNPNSNPADPNPQWRPFCGPLSNNTLAKSITILDSFFNYLVHSNYLLGNPLALDKRRKKIRKGKPKIVDRYLELDEIRVVLAALDEQSTQSQEQAFQVARAKYIILLLFYTGMRIAEASQHCMGDCFQREKSWFIRVLGKGQKLRDIPLPDALLGVMETFRTEMGLPTKHPCFKEQTPLIPMRNLKDPISDRRINQILKWAFKLGAEKLQTSEPHKASKLLSASAHWLRHSYVTYLLEAGAALKVAQENAGHSDIATTLLYQHIAQIDRHEASRNLSL